MKKILFSFFLILLPMLVNADPVEIDGIYYNLTKKAKKAEVTNNPNKYAGDIVIPEKVTYEGEEYDVTSIGHDAFAYSEISSAFIPNSVTTIGSSAFYSCEQLTSVNIPDGVTTIEQGTFMLIGASEFIIPKNIKRVSNRSIGGRSLTSVTILCGEGTVIEYLSICNINKETRNISVHIKDLKDWCGVSIAQGGIANTYQLFLDEEEISDLVIPDNVSTICDFAFNDCISLTSVNIPSSVTKMGTAFQNCPNISSVIFSEGLEFIGADTDEWAIGRKGAFADCEKITSIDLPNSIVEIGPYAFSNFKSLVTVTIGSKVKNIGIYAFANCVDLTDIYCYAVKVPSTENPYGYENYNPFKGSMQEYITLHVPAESINDYKAAEPWNQFKEIIGLNGENPETPKCGTPTISYSNGKLSFSSSTDGVKFVSEITDEDITKNYTNEVNLSITYNISVYAVKAGCLDSDVATATLCWIDTEPRTEGITNGVATVRAQAVLIQGNSGTFSVSGTDEGTPILIYNIAGQMVGSAKASAETTVIGTTLHSGDIGIVKIGEKSVKVLVK